MSVDVHEFSTGAVRSTDADDVRYDLISPIAMDEIAKTYAEGSAKYGDHNWLKGMPVSDLLNHAIRHVYMFLSGDRSEPHLPHAAWGLMAAIHSHKQWPHLNTNLLGPGCVPPRHEAEVTAEPASSLGGEAAKPDDSRIVALVIDGWTWDEIITTYPSLTEDDIRGCLSREIDSSLRGKVVTRECGSQLPCDDSASCPCWPDCDTPFDEFHPGLDCPACHGQTVRCKLCTSSAPQQSPVQPRDEWRGEWREFCDYMRWSPEPPRTAPRHDIPVIDDALNDRGPFPVLYISGPMSGHRDLNFPAFNKAAEKLRRMGFPVLNPADFGACNGLSWEENLHRDLAFLGFADILVQLPGWEGSRGASLEYNTAVALGKGITSVDTLIGEWQ